MLHWQRKFDIKDKQISGFFCGARLEENEHSKKKPDICFTFVSNFLHLKMGGLDIKLPSDRENYLEWSKETSLVQESQDLVAAKTVTFARKYISTENKATF